MSAALKSGQARERDRIKYPAEYNVKVDIGKVNLSVIKLWITTEISRILGADDDIIQELAFSHLESALTSNSRNPDIKQMHYELTQFLGADTAAFCKQLWALCVSAQNEPEGVPKELLEAKKAELQKEKELEKRAQEAARQRHERERDQERDTDRIRTKERDDRGRGRGRGGRRDSDRRRRSPSRESRSPPRPQDGNRSYRPSRPDSYLSRGSGRREAPRRARSPSRSPYRSRSPKRSRSPPPRRRRHSSTSPVSSRSPPPRNRGDSYRRARSPPRRRPSPAHSDHSQPRKRKARSRSRSPGRRLPPRRDRKKSPRRVNDLISGADKTRSDSRRLSREVSPVSDSASS